MRLYTYENISIIEKPIHNPLKGYAPLASETEYERDSSLVYGIIYWNDLEQVEGEYNFELLEEQWNMDKWKKEGKRFILRVMCDIPSTDGELNIPEWLYEKTKDGIWYETSYGKGYSPNYENPVFIEAHGKLLEALGERYNDDPYILCIQLGSLGHWGEWHVNNDETTMSFPNSDITNIYLEQYISSFSNKVLQIRRPLNTTYMDKLGLYNDVLGYEEGTEEWLDWCSNGYVSSQTDEHIKSLNKSLSDRYNGGEISSYESMEYYYSGGFESLLSQVKDSSTSFIGPNAPIWLDGYDAAIDKLEQELGYCFAVSGIGYLQIFNHIYVNITLENLNEIPMAENWTLRIFIIDEDGNICNTKDINAHLDELSTSKSIRTVMSIPKENFHIGVAIIDPITNEPAVSLANTESKYNKIYYLK